MTEQVRDPQGNVYKLAEELGSGGQGKVYAVTGHPRLVAKRFHNTLLKSEAVEPLRLKIAALQEKRLDRFLPQTAWPQFSLLDAQNRWCGYAMRKVKGIALPVLLNPARLEKQYPEIRRPELAVLAMTFLRTVALLHGQGVEIGDYNPQNFRFHVRRRELALIDTDAFQVRHQGGAFVCPVTAPDMTPPELLNLPVRHRWRNPENEVFSAAILTFLILTPGRHPFDAVGAGDCAETLLHGGFPYRPKTGAAGPPTGLIPKGIWSRVWDDFPVELQERFTAIFMAGHADLKKRGSLDELIQAVAVYETGFRLHRHLVMPLLGSPLAVAAKPPPAPRAPSPAPAPPVPLPAIPGPVTDPVREALQAGGQKLLRAGWDFIKGISERIVRLLVW